MLPSDKTMNPIGTLIALLLFVLPCAAQVSDRYAVVLAEPPLAARYGTRAELFTPAGVTARAQVEASQGTFQTALEARQFSVTGASSLLLNAVFVSTSPGRLAELENMPGVLGVVRLRKYKRSLNKALPLLGADLAWPAVGGFPNAGKGIRIGIIDTGVDQTHPSLQDNTLQAPPGFPKCDAPANCVGFTNSKVIVARSYVRRLAAGTGTVDPATSTPDDYSARDRSGHGTAVATSAAGNSSSGAVPISGVAPKAWVGSYKVFGSPQVNDTTSDDVLIAALEDALADGMDVISVSVGTPALSGPTDSGTACGNRAGVPCDPAGAAFEAAAQKGALIVVAGGNQGAEGLNYPTFGSITSPGTAPSVITVGGTTNSHGFTPAVRVPGPAVPTNISAITAQPTDAFAPYGASAGPLLDVARLGDDGYACNPLPAGALTNAFALIQRGPAGDGACAFNTKMHNAVTAGATAVIFYDYPDDPDWPITPSNLGSFGQPAVILANADGVNLKMYLQTNPGATVIIDPAGSDLVSVNPNELVYYSSMGPATGTNGIKPDLVTVAGGGQNGDLIYMGTQTWDPLGELYSATGYIAAAGTSFATPLAAGAAALVKQAHPEYSAAQVKSALVNTAAQDVLNDDSGDPVKVTQTGGGRLLANLGIQTNVTIAPASVSFGVVTSALLPLRQVLQITNTGTSPLSLALGLVNTASATSAPISLDKTTLTVAAGASSPVTVSITGTTPASGIYFGAVTIAGGSVPLRVPWMFVVGSTRVGNFVPISGDGNNGATGRVIPDRAISFRVTDANGIAISNAAVNFLVNSGSVPMTLSATSARTDVYGFASTTATAGDTVGSYSIEGCVGACTATNQFEYTFTGNIRQAATISAGGVVPAAGAAGPLAPGSYFSIYGTDLADSTAVTSTARLPVVIDRATVSFDVPSAGISLPARLVFVSSGQINAQVPWELAGQKSAQVKVIVNGVPGNVVTVPLTDAAPAFFENPIGSGVVAAVDPLNFFSPIITARDPAARGSVISLYANGLGAVNKPPASGEAASLTVLSSTLATPVVTIGGQNAPVLFSGLTPGLPGLYQINVTVPGGIGTGSQPVTLTLGGLTAKGSIPLR